MPPEGFVIAGFVTVGAAPAGFATAGFVIVFMTIPATGLETPGLTRTYTRKLNYIFSLWSILGRFPAKVRLGTVANGSGLKDAA